MVEQEEEPHHVVWEVQEDEGVVEAATVVKAVLPGSLVAVEQTVQAAMGDAKEAFYFDHLLDALYVRKKREISQE